MSTDHHCSSLPALLLAVLLADAPSPALGAGVVTGGTADDGYAASAFEKLGRHWSPPPGLHGDFKVQVEVRINERGGIAGCTTRQSSGMDAFDAAACGAVEQAGNLGVPPGAKPMTLYCTFQAQRERERRPDPDEELQKNVRARMDAENRFSTQRAGWAEEDARYKAEKAARAQGQTFEGYDFVPGQQLPGAREILDRPVRVQPGPQHPGGGAGRGAAPAAGGGLSLPEGGADLAVAPGRQSSQKRAEGARDQQAQTVARTQAKPAPVRRVTLGDVSAGIAVRRKAARTAPAQASARPAVQSGAVASGKRAEPSAGKPRRSPVPKGKAQAPASASGTPDGANAVPVVRQNAPDASSSPDVKEANAPSSPAAASRPRAEQGQPADAGRKPASTPARQASKTSPAGNASAEASRHVSSTSVPLDVAAGSSGGGQDSRVPVSVAGAKPSVPDGGGAQRPAEAKPAHPAHPAHPIGQPQAKPSPAAPSSSSGEVRGPVLYPPEAGGSQK